MIIIIIKKYKKLKVYLAIIIINLLFKAKLKRHYMYIVKNKEAIYQNF